MAVDNTKPNGEQQNLATTTAIFHLTISLMILKSGTSLLYLQLSIGLAL